MFVDAAARGEKLADHRLDSFTENWTRTADSWFNGTVESVDKRLAHVDRLISFAQEATGRLGNHIRAAAALPAMRDERDALAVFRERMLTGAAPLTHQPREAAVAPRPFTDFPDELLHLE
jgi:hypothetical protein